MIIESSQIEFSAEHQKLAIAETSSSRENFMVQLDAAQLRLSQVRLDITQTQAQWLQPAALTNTAADQASPSGVANGAWQSPMPSLLSATGNDFANSSARLFQALIDAITQRTQPFGWGATENASTATNPDMPDDKSGAATPLPDWRSPDLGRGRMIGVDVRVSEYIKEEECTRFCANGTINTADGQAIDLNLTLEMSRSFEVTREYSRREEVLFTDPLVINFDGHAAELTEDRFAFDLDADGVEEWISFVGAHSGLLALDANDDGVINDGTELFGALSGNGFADLAAYDSDANGFIDEADPIFEELSIWRKQDGDNRLDSLMNSGIGAIYLGATETPFELKDSDNQTLGQVRQSGIYLDEAGNVGTVQQIDMAV